MKSDLIKRIITVMLVLVLALCLAPSAAYAVDEPEAEEPVQDEAPAAGEPVSYWENVSFSYTDNGTQTPTAGDITLSVDNEGLAVKNIKKTSTDRKDFYDIEVWFEKENSYFVYHNVYGYAGKVTVNGSELKRREDRILVTSAPDGTNRSETASENIYLYVSFEYEDTGDFKRIGVNDYDLFDRLAASPQSLDFVNRSELTEFAGRAFARAVLYSKDGRGYYYFHVVDGGIQEGELSDAVSLRDLLNWDTIQFYYREAKTDSCSGYINVTFDAELANRSANDFVNEVNIEGADELVRPKEVYDPVTESYNYLPSPCYVYSITDAAEDLFFRYGKEYRVRLLLEENRGRFFKYYAGGYPGTVTVKDLNGTVYTAAAVNASDWKWNSEKQCSDFNAVTDNSKYLGVEFVFSIDNPAVKVSAADKPEYAFDSLSAALAADTTADGDTLTVYSNLAEKNITVNKSVTINLNGHTVNAGGTSESPGRVFTVLNGTTASVISESNTPGIITGGYLDFDDGGGIKVDAGAVLNLNNITVTGCTALNGGGLYIAGSNNHTEEGTVNIISCEICGNSAGMGSGGGGGIYNGGILNFNKGTEPAAVSDNSTYSGGGGIYNCGETFFTDDVIVAGNRAGSDGGGIYNTGSMTFSGELTVTGNVSETGYGGGLYTCTQITVNNAQITGNRAFCGGGFYDASGNKVVLNKVNILNNSASKNPDKPRNDSSKPCGGGIYCDNGCLLEIIDGSVCANTSENKGGGIFTESSIILKGNTSVTDNSSGDMGGGIFVFPGGTVRLSGKPVIQDNKCDGSDSNVVVEEVDIEGALSQGSYIGFVKLAPGNNSEKSGTFTNRYKYYNPDAGLYSFFHYDGNAYAQTWDSENKEIELSGTGCVLKLFSEAAGTSGSVARLKGGGTYAEGASVTVTAEPVDGYRFTGWYQSDIKKSDNPSYTFTVNDETVLTLTAKCEAVGTFTLTVGGVYAGNVDVQGLAATAVRNVWTASEGRISAAALKYTAENDETFLYWTDGNGNKLSGSESYVFSLVKNMTVIPVVSDPSHDRSLADVRFVLEESGALVSSCTVAVENRQVTGTVNMPVAPSRLGREFDAWVIGENVYGTDSDAKNAIERYAPGSENIITVKIRYKDAGTCTVTVKFIGVTHDDVVFSGITVGQAKTFTAGEVDGKTLRCWKDANGKILSYTPTCTVRPSGNITLTAEYGDSVVPAMKVPQIAVTDFTDFTDNVINKIRITSSYIVPESEYDSVAASGILYSKGNGENMVLGGDAKQYTSSLTSFNGNITINFTSGGTGTFYAVGFVTVEKNGVQTTYYSDRAVFTKNN